MTKKMKEMLVGIANGDDVNIGAQVALALGGRHARSYAATCMALLRGKYLQHAKAGGLEISADGRAAADKIKAKAAKAGASS